MVGALQRRAGGYLWAAVLLVTVGAAILIGYLAKDMMRVKQDLADMRRTLHAAVTALSAAKQQSQRTSSLRRPPVSQNVTTAALRRFAAYRNKKRQDEETKAAARMEALESRSAELQWRLSNIVTDLQATLTSADAIAAGPGMTVASSTSQQSPSVVSSESAPWTHPAPGSDGSRDQQQLAKSAFSVAPRTKGTMWLEDFHCGPMFLLPDGTAAECNPASVTPCCNLDNGWCGGSEDHCFCSRCIDYRVWRSNYR